MLEKDVDGVGIWVEA